MSFKIWLEGRKFDDNKDFIVSYLDLDENDALSVSLDSFDRKDIFKKIKDTNYYNDLDDSSKDRFENVLLKTGRTVGDLVRAVS
jgi:DUF1365 family protein